jgi:hypothetical protein
MYKGFNNRWIISLLNRLVNIASDSSVLDKLNSFNNRLLDGILLSVQDSLIDSMSNSFVDRSVDISSNKLFNYLINSSVLGENDSFNNELLDSISWLIR